MVKLEAGRISFSSRDVAGIVSTAVVVATLVVVLAFGIVPQAVAAAAGPPPGAASCSGCHPASSRVTSPVPRLAGREAGAIVQAMHEFRSGKRAGTVMDRIARGFTDEEIQAIAGWYATQR